MENETSLIPPRVEGSIVVGDRRNLGYAEFGPSDGFPLIWFHGTPGGRRQISNSARRAAQERSVRIVSIERPGSGLSTLHLYERIRCVADDIRRLADALELERFAVVGLSGGGPYALACAHDLPERVVVTALLGGVAPSRGRERAAGGPSALVRYASPLIARTHGPLGHLMARAVRSLEPLADPAIDLFASFMPPGDRLVFDDPLVRRMFVDDMLHAADRHLHAPLMDAILFGRHWGFELADIEGRVLLWYGDADNIVPFTHGEHMAGLLRSATLARRPGEGHLGGLGASEELFDAILGARDEAAAPS